jgi:hypothetical protein
MPDIRVVVGVLLVIAGLLGAWRLFPLLSDSYKLPDKLFDYALFTVALGSIAVLYKLYTDKLDKARAAAAQAETDLRAFSDEIIALYTGFKSVRREVRAQSDYAPGQPITLPQKAFDAQYSRLNGFQHRLEQLDWRLRLTQRFLGQDQDRILAWVQTCEGYTDAVVTDVNKVTRDDGHVTIPEGNALFGFFQPNHTDRHGGPQAEVNKKFFYPMKCIRDALRARVEGAAQPTA